MANKKSLIDILVGIDVDKSTSEISGGLSQILEETIKPILLSLELDPTSITNIKQSIESLTKDFEVRVANIQPTQIKQDSQAGTPVTGIDLSEQFADPANMERITKFLKEQNIQFKGMQIAISNATQDVDGFVRATLRLNETDNLIRNITIGLDHLGEGGNIQVMGSTLQNNFNKILEGSIQKLRQTSDEITKLQQKEKMGTNTANDEATKIALNNKLFEQQTAIMTQINAAKEQGLILTSEQVAMSSRIQTLVNKTENQEAANLEVAKRNELNEQLKEYERLIQQVYKLKTNPPVEKEATEVAELIKQGEARIQQLREQDYVYDKLKQKAKDLKELEIAKKEDSATLEKYNKELNLLNQLEKVQKNLSKLEIEHAKKSLQSSAQSNQIREQQIARLKNTQRELESSINTTTVSQISKLKEKFESLNAAARVSNEEVKKITASIATLDDKVGKVVKVQLPNGGFVDFTIPKEKIEEGISGLEQYTKMLHGADSSVSNLRKSTKNLVGVTHEFTVKQGENANVLKISKYAYDANTGAVRLMGEETRLNANRMLDYHTQLQVAIKRMFAWGLAAQILYGTLRKIREGLTFLIELDKNLTQVAVVQNTVRESTKGLASQYTDLAKEMKKSVKEISEVNMELIRQGLTLEEAAERMQVILKLSSAALVTTDQSLTLITSSVNAMHTSAERTADVMLKASMISASNVEGLADAFTKTASSAYAAGLEIEEVTALLATMKETTQESDSNLGTSLKTILARFNRVNEETGELNEDLNDVQTAFESVGIQFRDSQGEIRNIFTLLTELHGIWGDLTGVQQAYIATQAAGTRMQNRFFAIMSNFNKVLKINNELMESGGTLNESYSTYLDSVEAAQIRLTVAIEKFWVEMLNPDTLKIFYNTLSAIVEKANELGGVNLLLGGASTALFGASPMVGAVLESSKARKQIEKDVFNLTSKQTNNLKEQNLLMRIIKEQKLDGKALDESDLKVAQEQLASTKINITHTAEQLKSLQGQQKALSGNNTLLGKTKVLLSGAKTSLGLMVKSFAAMGVAALAFVAISYTISKVFSAIDKKINESRENLKKLGESTTQIQKDMELASLVRQLQAEEELIAKQMGDKEKLLSLQKQIAAIKPGWVDKIDSDTLEPLATDSAAMAEYSRETLENTIATAELNKGNVENDLEKKRAELKEAEDRINELNEIKSKYGKSLGFDPDKRIEKQIDKVKELRDTIITAENDIAKVETAKKVLQQRDFTDNLKNQRRIYEEMEKILKSKEKGTAEYKAQKVELEKQKKVMLELLGSEKAINLLLSDGTGALELILDIKDKTTETVLKELEGRNMINQAEKDSLEIHKEMLKNKIDLLKNEIKIAKVANIANRGAWRHPALTMLDAKILQDKRGELAALEKDLTDLDEMMANIKVYKPGGGGSKDPDPVPDPTPYTTQLDELHSLLEKIAIKEKEIARFQAFKDFASEKEKEYLLVQENALLEEQIQLNQELEKEYSKLLDSSLNVARGLAAQYPEYLELDEVTKQVIISQDALAKETDGKVKESIENAALAVTKYRDALDNTQMSIIGFQKAQWDLATTLIKEAIDDKISSLDAQIKSIEKNQDAQIERINKALKEQEEYYENQIKLKQEQIDLIDQQLEQEQRLAALKDKTDELTKLQTDRRYTYITEMGQELYTFDRMQYDQLWREREELIRQYKNDDLKNALQREIDDLNAARARKKEVANKEIEDLKAANQARIDNLKAAQEALKELQNKGLADIQEGLDEFEAMFGETVSGIEALAARIAAALAMLNKQPQRQGGGAWDTTSEERYGNFAGAGGSAAVERANELGINSSNMPGLTEAEYNDLVSSPGFSIYDPDKHYHRGGIVGGQSFNPQTEQVAKLLLGEVVLNEKHLENVPNILQELSAAMVKKQFDASQISKLIPSSQTNNTTEYHLHNVNINTNNANDFFKQIEHLVVARTGA